MIRDYYNEIDEYAAQWLRNLIAAGLLPPGDVDTRSIEDVRPDDLLGYRRCHFFAGIGIWAHALEEAGWPADLPVWTGSCPCQPFSAAGKGEGFADERHLWPAWDWLIGQCRPPIVLGEQVEGRDGLVWNDLVSSDMEAKGYAFGAAIVPAAGFGVAYGETSWGEWLDRAVHDCPDPVVAGALADFARFARRNIGVGGSHLRHRQYWIACRMADALPAGRAEGRTIAGGGQATERGPSGGVGFPDSAGSQPGPQGGTVPRHGRPVEPASGSGRMDNGIGAGLEGHAGNGDHGDEPGRVDPGPDRSATAPGGVGDTYAPDGVGRDADWLYCRDGKWRPAGPGAFPLAHEAPARMGRLRAYGNGLDAETAIAFTKAAIGAITQ